MRSVMTVFKPVSVLGVDDEALGERDLPFLAAQPPLGLVEQPLRLAVLARGASDGDARSLPNVVMVDFGNGRADTSLQLCLRRAEVVPLLLQGVRVGELQLTCEDADEAAGHARDSIRAMSEVQAFVGNAHGDVDAVREALAADPTLANAGWDWGDGDWETTLGAASHMLAAHAQGAVVELFT